MTASNHKRKFETLILAVGIFMALLAGINSVWYTHDRYDTNQFKAIIEEDLRSMDTDQESAQACCQQLKIYTIN